MTREHLQNLLDATMSLKIASGDPAERGPIIAAILRRCLEAYLPSAVETALLEGLKPKEP